MPRMLKAMALRNADRWAEAANLFGLFAYYVARGDKVEPMLLFAAMAGSIQTSYVKARVEVKAVDRHTDKVLWANVLSSVDQFPTVSSTVVTTSPEFLQQNLRSQDIANLPNIQVAQTQQAASSTNMMTKMAQNIYSAMSSGF